MWTREFISAGKASHKHSTKTAGCQWQLSTGMPVNTGYITGTSSFWWCTFRGFYLPLITQSHVRYYHWQLWSLLLWSCNSFQALINPLFGDSTQVLKASFCIQLSRLFSSSSDYIGMTQWVWLLMKWGDALPHSFTVDIHHCENQDWLFRPSLK